MIELESELMSMDLLHSLLLPCDTVQDVDRKYGAVVNQEEMKMICEHCSRSNMISTSYIYDYLNLIKSK